MDSVLHDLGELPVWTLVLVGLLSGGTILSVKPGAVDAIKALIGLINGVVFGMVGTIVYLLVIYGLKYDPHKLWIFVVAFVCAYLAQVIRGWLDGFGYYLTKYKGRLLKQLVITVLEFFLNKIKKS